MDLSGLSLHQAPPFRAVYRFFLTAPVLFAAGGLYVFFISPGAHISPATAALVHFITLGFLTMTMMGALMQMLPVMVGVVLPKPSFFSALVYYPFITGLLAFITGLIVENFGEDHTLWMSIASVLIAFSILVYIFTTTVRLLSSSLKTSSALGIFLALLSFLAAASMGIVMIIAKITGQMPVWEPGFLILHLYWALGGWVFTLVAVVSFQIVPMFYVTPPHSKLLQKYTAPFIFLLGVLLSFSGSDRFASWAGYLWAFLALLYSYSTFSLLNKRKRKLPDYTLWFWKLSMISLIAVSAFWFLDLASGLRMNRSDFFYLCGLTYLFGFAASVVNGMLYKIVPFLSWFHPAGKGIMETPNMKELVPDKKIQTQFGFFLSAYLFSLAAVFFPVFWKFAGASIFLSGFLLWKNLYGAVRVYKIYYKKAETT